jgi:RNA polymerase sigma-70 factor (ECF subfamily)
VDSLKQPSDKARAEPEKSQDIDRPLVERARQGDVDAFRDLVRRYESRAHSIALGVVGSREDAEDVVQEAFLKAFRNLGSFRGQSSFYTWFYRIVFNLAIDLSRKRYRKSESSMGDTAAMDSLTMHSAGDASDFLGSVPNPDQVFQRNDLGKSIAKALDSLSSEHRAVIMLREIEGLSYSEISDVVGCSKGTVMSRLHHARKRLQRALAEYMTWRARSSEQKGQAGREDLIEEGNMDADDDAAQDSGTSFFERHSRN